MQLESKRPTLVNASHFYRAELNPQCTVYSSSPSEVIPIASFENGLSRACYRTVFHPFAQVVENTSTGEFLLVRDHLGLRPLYYRYQSGQLIFGDTIPDIICQLPSAPVLLDSELTHLFGDVHHYTDKTLHTGIHRVEPGHMLHIKSDGRMTKSAFWQLEQEGDTLYYRHYFKTLREIEWSFLQGPNSHEVRMRIEYSSIVAKKMGFDYRYPLLHPKLLEFFLSLPLEQKRHKGVGRHMMRRYLAQIMPASPFNIYKKKESLNILPATMDTFKEQWNGGLFQTEFHPLPKTLTQDKSPHKAMIKTIQAFMLNANLNHIH